MQTLARALLIVSMASLLTTGGVARAEGDLLAADKVAKVVDGAAQLGQKVGELVVERVELHRLPKPENLAKAETNPNDHWNPFLALIVNNPNQAKAILSVTVKLEDESGASLFEGSKTLTIDGEKKTTSVGIDPSMPLRIGAWKSLSQVHLIASVTPLALNQAFPLTQAGAPVNQKVGGVVVEQVVLTNVPTAEELDQASKDAGLKTRPKVALLLGNPTDAKVKVKMRVMLEDEGGVTYMDCGERTEKLAPKSHGKSFTLCGGGVRMKTAEWPKVTRARVVFEVE
ncbi:MAG: hypothetical protein QM765_26165 [Myxococcales bacterium]